MSTQTVDTATRSTYAVDTTHSQVGFKVRHLGFSKVAGRFEKFDVTLEVDPSDLSGLNVEAAIDTASINTGVADRDAHLRSADFFESETYPTMNFVSRGLKRSDGTSFELEGDLTIRDITRPVVLKGEFLGEATDPWGNSRVAFEASTTIDRKEFGLTWNQVLETGGLLVAEKVEVILEVQAVRQGESSRS